MATVEAAGYTVQRIEEKEHRSTSKPSRAHKNLTLFHFEFESTPMLSLQLEPCFDNFRWLEPAGTMQICLLNSIAVFETVGSYHVSTIFVGSSQLEPKAYSYNPIKKSS